MKKGKLLSKIFSYNTASVRKFSILFALIIFALLSVSSVLALETTLVNPGPGTFEYTIPMINATTDFNANCSYNISDGVHADLIATLDGNDTLDHGAENVVISSLDDGSLTLTIDCYNSSDGIYAPNVSTVTKATDAPQITWNTPSSNHSSYSFGQTITLNITATITGSRSINNNTSPFTAACGSLGTYDSVCKTPGNECNFTQGWTAPSSSTASCTITADVNTSMDSIQGVSNMNVSSNPACGDTITSNAVLTADLTGCAGNGLRIGANGVTVDCNGHSITGSGVSSGINNSAGYNSTVVKNCIITNFSNGVYFGSGAMYGQIENNTASFNYEGISFLTSSSNNITDNTLVSNTNMGVILRTGSNGNLIRNNTARNSSGGIYLGSGSACSSNTITGNNVTNNSIGITLDASSSSNVITNNTAALNTQGIFIAGSSNTMNYNRLYNNTASDLNISSGSGNDATLNYWGDSVCDANITGITKSSIVSYYTNYALTTLESRAPVCGCGETVTVSALLMSDLSGCTGTGITIGTAGITLDCAGHYIQGDYVSSGSEYGVYLSSKNGVTIQNCTIYGYNTTSGVEAGIYATGSNNVLLLNNTLYNNYYGAWIAGGSGSNVTGSNIYSTAYKGIFIDSGTSGFRVTGNNVHDTYWTGAANAAGISVYAASAGTVFGNTLTNVNGTSGSIIAGIHVLDAGNMNVSGNTARGLNTTGISVNDPGVGANGFTVADNSVTYCLNGVGVAGSNHNITRNTVANNSGTGLSIDENTVHVWHNNIYGNGDSQIYINPMATIELSLGSQGNYWGHSSCPVFLVSDVKNGYTTVTDSYAYNASDGWSTYGAPPICSIPNVSTYMPGVSGIRMFSVFNFSVNVTDSAAVTGVTIWNGTAAQPMALTDGTATAGLWSAVVYLSGFSDGLQTLAINATNGGRYNDSESFSVIIDNTASTVTPSSPAANFNTSAGSFDAVFTFTDAFATNATCNATLYNASGTPVSTSGNDTTINNTATTLTLNFAAPGVYTWNVTCYDKAASNVLTTVNGNAGSSATRTVTYDVVGPVINEFRILQSDDFVSSTLNNMNVTLYVNVTDVGTGVKYVELNLSSVSGQFWTHSGLVDYVNLTCVGNECWDTITATDTSNYDFDLVNITLNAYDYAGLSHAGQDVYTLILYNLTRPSSINQSCENFGSGTTDFSWETDFEYVDFTLEYQINRSEVCGGPPPYDDTFLTVMSFNFSDINFSDLDTVEKLSNLHSAIAVNMSIDGQFGDSRIYVNSTYFDELNETATINFYWLPFDSAPEIVPDSGAAGVFGVPIYTPFDYGGQTFGNLTFSVNGFSGYDISDTVNPLITVNSPAPNQTVVQGPTPLINVSVNGTGTQVSNVTVYVDATPYYMSGMICYNATGSELMNCYFTPTVSDATYTLTVYAWDYGGAQPGNSNNTVWQFTSDASAPIVSNNQSNVTGIVTDDTVIMLNITATDATNVSNVTAGNVNTILMGNHTASDYNLTTTPAALGCTVSGTCVVTFNATDYWGNYNSSFVTSFTVDVGPPSVSGVSVTNATNVSSSVQVNIQATIADPAGVASVFANNSQQMYLLSGTSTSGVWYANLTATDLGCSPNTVCTIMINATDTLGNYNDTETTSYYVDDANPAVTSPSASPAQVKSASALYIGAVVTDVSNVTSVVSNSSVALTKGASSWNATTSAGALGCAANAVCTIGFTATDMAGNANNSVTKTVIVDDVAPTVTFVHNSTNLTTSGAPLTLNVTAVDGNTVSSVTANGQAMSSPASDGNYTYAGNAGALLCTSSGTCTVTFNATDLAGNSATTTTVLTIDNDGPVVTGPSVNVTKAKIGDAVMIRVTATDSPAGMNSVVINGSVAMTAMGGGVYELNRTGTLIGCAANSLCTIGFTATDARSNTNTTVTTTYTTDNLIQAVPNDFTYSSVSSSGATVSSSSFTEDVICTINYGTNESLLGTVAAGSISATGAVTLSGLSASTTYYYNVTQCQDAAGNIDTTERGPFNFTTSAASTGGGGGGGGGGTYSTSSTIELGDITGAQIEMELGRGDTMSFGHDGEQHEVKVLALSENYADFEVLSEPQSFRLYIGQSNDVDVDDDAKPDITVKLLDIISGKALVKITSMLGAKDKIVLLPPSKRTVTEAPAEEVAAAGVAEAAAPAAPGPDAAPSAAPAPGPDVEKRGMSASSVVFALLLAVVVIVIISVIVLEVRKKSHGGLK